MCRPKITPSGSDNWAGGLFNGAIPTESNEELALLCV